MHADDCGIADRCRNSRSLRDTTIATTATAPGRTDASSGLEQPPAVSGLSEPTKYHRPVDPECTLLANSKEQVANAVILEAANHPRLTYLVGFLIWVLLPGPAGAGEHEHMLASDRQAGETIVRVLTPTSVGEEHLLKALYVLPVEAGEETKWGDPWAEVRRLDLANRHDLIVILPTFSALPWYADHPEDSRIQQESYFLQDVLPLVDRTYPVAQEPDGRLLVGFSKSGWGAWSLLLRHPHLFGKAVAWDAPLMQAAPDRYGMAPIFGSHANFERYRITSLLREKSAALHGVPRLILTGYFAAFRAHHIAMHGLLKGLAIPHVYRDGPKRAHRWDSGWLQEAVTLLLADSGDQ